MPNTWSLGFGPAQPEPPQQRQLFAIAVLPFTVTVLIPLWLARRNGMAQVGGLCLLAVGGLLFLASLRRFVAEGRGTLAP